MSHPAPALLIILLLCSAFADADSPPEAQEHRSSGSLVVFLTQTDPAIAGHALHFATHAAIEQQRATILLVGEAGRIGLKGGASPASAIDGKTLQSMLLEFIAAGGRVFVPPRTLKTIASEPQALIEGVKAPEDRKALRRHMFDSATKVMVW